MPTLVLTEHYLPQRGGSINWLLQTYSRYAPSEVVLVTTQAESGTDADLASPFPVERLPMSIGDWDPTRPASFGWYARLLARVWRTCRRDRIEQVHCVRALPEGLVAWALERLRGTPYLLYAHGEEILIAASSRRLRWILPRVYRRARAVIANSEHTRMLLERVGVERARIHVIHPGVDASAYQASAEAVRAIRERHGLGERPVLLTVGRLQRRKGQDMVIRSLPLVAERFPEVRYLVAGSGEGRAELEALAAEVGVSERVVFAGRVPEAEQAAYYGACDVFVMPNRQIGPDIEGFGMVFLEAGAAGKPVIGGRSGGTGEAIVEGETGLRVDGTEREAIAAAVVALLADPQRARALGENARRRVETEFSWESVVRRTRALAASV